MHCYLVTILYLCTTDDRTETFTDELEALALFKDLVAQEKGKDYVQIMYIDIDNDAGIANVRHDWVRP